MAIRLYSITNVTTVNAQFTNQEASSDSTPVATNTIAHTTGKDGDYCKIPDCSASTYFNDHHMTVSGTRDGKNWQVAFWNDDAQDHLLYYSLNGTYASGQPVEGSASWTGVDMMVLDVTNPTDSTISTGVKFFVY